MCDPTTIPNGGGSLDRLCDTASSDVDELTSSFQNFAAKMGFMMMQPLLFIEIFDVFVYVYASP